MEELQKLVLRYPELSPCLSEVKKGAELLLSCFRKSRKLLLCGNGGSCADCEHIAGELVKQFSRSRPLPAELEKKLGPALAKELHGGLPALSLPSMIGFHTAFNNDDNPEYAFAQQVVAFGQEGDVLMGISTSGNSTNVIRAAETARAMGLKVLSLTGREGGLWPHLQMLPYKLLLPKSPGFRNSIFPSTIACVRSWKTLSFPKNRVGLIRPDPSSVTRPA